MTGGAVALLTFVVPLKTLATLVNIGTLRTGCHGLLEAVANGLQICHFP
ncbi:MAG: hypothetical protein ACR2OB_13745 [Solirubrobacteraceae bacterium]